MAVPSVDQFLFRLLIKWLIYLLIKWPFHLLVKNIVQSINQMADPSIDQNVVQSIDQMALQFMVPEYLYCAFLVRISLIKISCNPLRLPQPARIQDEVVHISRRQGIPRATKFHEVFSGEEEGWQDSNSAWAKLFRTWLKPHDH